MRKSLAIAAAQGVRHVGKMVNRGSSMPGKMALSIDPDILSKVELPDHVVVVTGTTGKTSITQMINEILKSQGWRIASNVEGANLLNGVTSTVMESVNLSGRSQVDALVLEIDERYVKKVFDYFKPTLMCVTNLSRDQLARNGHPEIILEEFQGAITDDIHLVVNEDSPMMKGLGLQHGGPTTSYGIGRHDRVRSDNENPYADEAFSPFCQEKLEYDFYHYGEFGHYKCPSSSFRREKPDYEVTAIDEEAGTFTINGDKQLKIQNEAFYSIYNELIAFTMAKQLGIEDDAIIRALDEQKLQTQRFRTYSYEGRPVRLMTTKNETPMSYNSSIGTIRQAQEPVTALFGFQEIARHYGQRDLSWLWDVNFEALKDSNVSHYVVLGPFAKQFRARMAHAGIEPSKIILEEDTSKVLEVLDQTPQQPVYGALYFDSESIVVDQLEGQKGVG